MLRALFDCHANVYMPGRRPVRALRPVLRQKVVEMAFFHSDSPRQPILNAPASVLLLIGAIVLVHVAIAFLPPELSDRILPYLVFIPARYAEGGDGTGFLALAAPFIGHMFAHADFLHLGVNCLWLLAFGPVVARRYGAGLFYLFFFLCGIAGALSFLVLNWGLNEGVIGASGAISGLMAAGIRMFPWAGRQTDSLAPILSRQVLSFSGIWLALNLVFGLTGIGAGGEIHQIAWQAHMGGYFAGLFLASAFELIPRRPPTIA